MTRSHASSGTAEFRRIRPYLLPEGVADDPEPSFDARPLVCPTNKVGELRADQPEAPEMVAAAPTAPQRPDRKWVGATYLLLSMQTVCGWLPPSILDHVAASLGVGVKAVADHIRDAMRAVARSKPVWLLPNHLMAVRDCADFLAAWRVLLGLGIYAPYASVEQALWEAPELLLGGLQDREVARRDAAQPCPLCGDEVHSFDAARAA